MVRDPWLEHCLGAGIATGFGDEWKKVGPYKLFADGGIGPRTATVTQPYRGEPDYVGIARLTEEELTDCAVRAARGVAVAVHAIGDGAIRLALNALARAAEESRAGRYPHRIEHCVLPTPDDVALMRRLGVAAAVQPAFLYSRARARRVLLGLRFARPLGAGGDALRRTGRRDGGRVPGWCRDGRLRL